MINKIKNTFFLVFLVFYVNIVNANEKNMPVAVGVAIGLGYEVNFAMKPRFLPEYLNMRFSFNSLDYNHKAKITDIVATYAGYDNVDADSDTKIKLFHLSALTDWYPFDNGFRITGGLAYNDSNLESLIVGDVELTIDNKKQVRPGTIKGKVSFAYSIIPYIGLGYGDKLKNAKGLSFEFDFGLYFTGSPIYDVKVTGITPEERAKLDENSTRKEIEKYLKNITFFSRISFGVSYAF